MKRLWRFVHDAFTRYIQVRLTVHFLLILVPLVAVSLFANMRSHQILEAKTSDRTRSLLQSAVEYIDLTMRNMEEISNLLTRNQAVNGWLSEAGSELSVQSVVHFGEIIGELSDIVALNNMLYQVSVLHAPTDTLLSSRFGGIRLKDASLEPWYRKAAELNGFSYLHIPNENAYPLRGEYAFNKESVYLIRGMNASSRSFSPNFIILGIKKNSLLQLIASSLPSAGAQAYLYDHEDRLVVGTDPTRAPSRLSEWGGDGARTVRVSWPERDSPMLAVKVISPQTHWSLVMLQPEAELYEENRQLQLFTYTIIAISIVLAFWVSWMVYGGIAAPLRSLSFGMKQIRLGNLNVTLDNRRKDELGYVTESFNQMAQDQRSLIRDYYEQQLRASKAELKFLQSQINPHFLYNTLDSIYWTAQEYEAEEIGDMVYNLSKFFRLSLQKGQETATVRETMEHLNYYVRVQELRFQHHFAVVYDVDDTVKEVAVLRLLLQPLVENAILHGLEKAAPGGLLTISAKAEGEFLALGVADNGAGMSEDRLDYIRRELGATTADDNRVLSPFDPNKSKDLFGLRNVVARVKIVYGDEASFRIDSEPGAGTRVKLLLPMEACQTMQGGETA